MYNVILVNIAELYLKGKNRPKYLNVLRKQLNKVIKIYHQGEVSFFKDFQRLIFTSNIPFSEDTITAVRKIPGIHSIMLAKEGPKDLDKILPILLEEIAQYGLEEFSFKIAATRSDKSFPITTPEINKLLGHEVLLKFPKARVDLKKPQITPEILVLSKSIFISAKRLSGIGGLPVGMSGHLITLLSGGIDSPVASFMMSKRGCAQTFVFFHSYPFVGEEVLDKIFKLSKIIGQYQLGCRLYIIPFGEIQNLISKKCLEEYRTVFFRKFMIEAANILADQIKGEALLTGDSISQVSSQTIGNLAILDKCSTRPIFRPLIGLNKNEIVEKAEQIGTFETSIIPHDDACSLFAPLRPVIHPSLKYWEEFSEEFKITDDLLNCVKNAKVYEISPKGDLILLEEKI